MSKIDGTKGTDNNTLLDVLLTLKQNIMRDLNVAEVCQIVELRPGSIAIVNPINNDKQRLYTYNLYGSNLSVGELVLVIFTNTDPRINISRVNNYEETQNNPTKRLHAIDYGVIVGKATGGASVTLYDTTGQNTDGAMTQKASTDYFALKTDVHDAILTINRNGVQIGTFSANAGSNASINIAVPTTAADVNALPDSTKYTADSLLTFNTNTYEITLSLKDQDGNTIGVNQTITLPIAKAVVNASYNTSTKVITLTANDSSTITLDLSSIINGLQAEITSSNMLSADLVDDTGTTHKFVTINQINTWNGKQDAIDSSHKLSADLVDDTNSTNKFATSSQLTQIGTNQTDIANIKALIPSQASPTNQMADKNFVNSSINAFAAYYITRNAAGDPFRTYNELISASTFYNAGVTRVPTTNDYCIVLADENKGTTTTGYTSFTTTAQYVGHYIIYNGEETEVTVANKDNLNITPGTTVCYDSLPTTRYLYQGGSYPSGQWDFQYIINETPLTAAQVAAINSGITAALVAQITQNQTDISTLNSLVVHLSGPETIGGEKTFGASPILNNAVLLKAKNSGGTAKNLIGITASNNVVINNENVGNTLIGGTALAPISANNNTMNLGVSGTNQWNNAYIKTIYQNGKQVANAEDIKNATITITQGGVVKGSFTLNQSSNDTIALDAGGGSSTDVQINGTSIVANNIANIITNSAYDAITNKIATMLDIPTSVNGMSGGTITSTTYVKGVLGVKNSSDTVLAAITSTGTVSGQVFQFLTNAVGSTTPNYILYMNSNMGDVKAISKANLASNFYWANVPLSTSSSTTTEPTVKSITVGGALLEYDNDTGCLEISFV